MKDRPTSELLTLGEAGPKIMMLSLIVGAVSLVLAAGMAFTGGVPWFKQFSFTYLVSFCFFATLSLGGLFFVLILHLTRGGWGVSVRRIAEILGMMIIPMLALFLPILIPVLMGYDALYEWNGSDVSELVEHKQKWYLNGGLFGPEDSDLLRRLGIDRALFLPLVSQPG